MARRRTLGKRRTLGNKRRMTRRRTTRGNKRRMTRRNRIGLVGFNGGVLSDNGRRKMLTEAQLNALTPEQREEHEKQGKQQIQRYIDNQRRRAGLSLKYAD